MKFKLFYSPSYNCLCRSTSEPGVYKRFSNPGGITFMDKESLIQLGDSARFLNQYGDEVCIELSDPPYVMVGSPNSVKELVDESILNTIKWNKIVA